MSVADGILLDALTEQWEGFRWSRRLPLRAPIMALHGGKTRLGLWMRVQRTLSMSREHCLEDPWLDVSETLLHEMAHQLVDEVYGGEKNPHGPLFQRVLNDLGGVSVATGEEPKVVGRVRKLLALAGSSNRHEAEAAMAKAQKLMIKNRIDRARLDGDRGMVRRQIGQPSLRQARWRGALLGVVGKHFFVKSVQASVFLPNKQKWGRVNEIVGRPEDVEMASYAFAFVESTAERLWKAHLSSHPNVGRSRARFLLGVVMGFAAKLESTAKTVHQEGLVWMGDPDLDELWTRRYPRISSKNSRFTADEHYYAGQKAGGGVVLHRPIQNKGSGGGLLEG